MQKRVVWLVLLFLLLSPAAMVASSADPILPLVPLPIHINGDAELAQHPAVVGSGTMTDPFRIEGLHGASSGPIVRSGMIRVTNTTLPLLIQDNLLTYLLVDSAARGCAIHLESVANVRVSHNLLLSSTEGICVLESELVELSSNYIRAPDQSATFARAFVNGIFIRGSSQIQVRENEMVDMPQGITLQGGSRSVLLQGNVVQGDSLYFGISMYDASHVLSESNTLRNLGGGVYLRGVDNVTLSSDSLRDLNFAFFVEPGLDGARPSREVHVDNWEVSAAGSWTSMRCSSCSVSNSTIDVESDLGYFRGLDEGILLTHNTFRTGGEGFGRLDGTVSARWNNFEEPEADYVWSEDRVQDWQDNHWGSPEGPTEAMAPTGIDFEPWAVEPF